MEKSYQEILKMHEIPGQRPTGFVFRGHLWRTETLPGKRGLRRDYRRGDENAGGPTALCGKGIGACTNIASAMKAPEIIRRIYGGVAETPSTGPKARSLICLRTYFGRGVLFKAARR